MRYSTASTWTPGGVGSFSITPHRSGRPTVRDGSACSDGASPSLASVERPSCTCARLPAGAMTSLTTSRLIYDQAVAPVARYEREGAMEIINLGAGDGLPPVDWA